MNRMPLRGGSRGLGARGVRMALPLLSALLASGGLAAQEFPQPLFQAPFTFPNPGARSLGFGGAFVALADDATAAFANPAGLVQLLEPEVSLDVRLWEFSTRYTVGGRISGAPTGLGLDDTAGLRFDYSDDRLSGLSFVSYVYPKHRWSFAFYRHLQGNFESSTETRGLFADVGGSTVRVTDQRTASDFELTTYGVAAGFRVTDALSIGAALVYFDGMLELDAATYARDDESPAGLFDSISYLPEQVRVSQVLAIDDDDWGINVGVLWKLSPTWSLGAVARDAPTFEFRGVGVAGPANRLGAPPGATIFEGRLGDIELPQGYGFGLAYRAPPGHITIAAEWSHVGYRDVAGSLELDDQEIDNADELHFGGEYVFLDATPVIAVRLGAWFDPDHLMRGNGSDEVVDAFLPPGEDDVHYAAGLGFAFESFQVDVGVDLSDRSDTVSVSAVFSL